MSEECHLCSSATLLDRGGPAPSIALEALAASPLSDEAYDHVLTEVFVVAELFALRTKGELPDRILYRVE